MNAEASELRPYLTVAAALVGAVVGSFLNVCIVSWGAEPKQSVVRPRSRCPHCGTAIAWYDNIPVLSWLLLRGRCRGCGKPVPVQYPLVEIGTAIIWAYMAARYGADTEALRGALFGTILLGIAVTDLRTYIIPDEFTLGGLVLGLGLSLLGPPGLMHAGIGAAAGFLLLWAVGAGGSWLFKQEAMGGGDIKMMAMVGAFLGWKGVLLTIFLGALLGSLIFVPMHLAGSRRLVPFGVFLALGAAATWLAGPAVYAWYAGTLGLS